ncbi:hypothetical protein AVEN_57854-1 [Araneus ventricosus]|uniref:Uncharacterized protein n=1 Tax=Araneus ventricosus TaxID=182803 RepID=A0A4Y2HNH6_ARAVE|nr:hypothetical protein AVEN_57854-1 [Araneus ventricosus]
MMCISKRFISSPPARVPGASAERMKELWNISSLNVMNGKTSEALTFKKTAALLKNFCKTANQEKSNMAKNPPIQVYYAQYSSCLQTELLETDSGWECDYEVPRLVWA